VLGGVALDLAKGTNGEGEMTDDDFVRY